MKLEIIVQEKNGKHLVTAMGEGSDSEQLSALKALVQIIADAYRRIGKSEDYIFATIALAMADGLAARSFVSGSSIVTDTSRIEEARDGQL